MQLRDLIGTIGATYDRHLPMSSEAQLLLRSAPRELPQWIPGGYMVTGSGGIGGGAISPWIGVFNPAETTTAQKGMYVVYLFAADMKRVYLTLNQGVTEISERLGRQAARNALNQEAAQIRAAFETATIHDLDEAIDLRSKADLPRNYEYANILARAYLTDDLPDEATMVADLQRFVQLYDLALEAREEGSQRGVPGIVTPPREQPRKKTAVVFKPKDDGEYRKMIAAREVTIYRRHETLVNDYEAFLRRQRFTTASPHPRDLTAERDGRHWLIEAKAIRAGDAETAAREAFAQLCFYEHFLYDDTATVSKLALFNEPLGAAHLGFFERKGIAVVWRRGDGWLGTDSAQSAGLC
ncbi:MrcB family domain-containing protein [Krasilnikovia sp. MM14-A1259]|uniref:MrcB family domain-containing protein n=1 Tax=Krasilnikovia sp. MM14-A1259 TaxID=3373539 RepID=UPI00381392A2